MNKNTKVLTIKEVAAIYNLSERYVFKLAKEGSLPGVFKISGTTWRVESDKLFEAWGAPDNA